MLISRKSAGATLISFLGKNTYTVLLVSNSGENPTPARNTLKNKAFTLTGTALYYIDVIPSNPGSDSNRKIVCASSHSAACLMYWRSIGCSGLNSQETAVDFCYNTGPQSSAITCISGGTNLLYYYCTLEIAATLLHSRHGTLIRNV